MKTTINRSELMKKAHMIFKNTNRTLLEQIKSTPNSAPWKAQMYDRLVSFSSILKRVWAEAKAAPAPRTNITPGMTITIEYGYMGNWITFTVESVTMGKEYNIYCGISTRGINVEACVPHNADVQVQAAAAVRMVA